MFGIETTAHAISFNVLDLWMLPSGRPDLKRLPQPSGIECLMATFRWNIPNRLSRVEVACPRFRQNFILMNLRISD